MPSIFRGHAGLEYSPAWINGQRGRVSLYCRVCIESTFYGPGNGAVPGYFGNRKQALSVKRTASQLEACQPCHKRKTIRWASPGELSLAASSFAPCASARTCTQSHRGRARGRVNSANLGNRARSIFLSREVSECERRRTSERPCRRETRLCVNV